MATSAAYRQWPAPARTLALAIDAAVAAALAGEAEDFEQALADLAHADREQLGILLGDVTRALIECAHPDGLDSDDAEELLRSCIRSAAPWYRPLDTDALLRALTGALGIGDAGPADEPTERAGESDDLPQPDAPDDRARPDAAAVLAHGVLLVADQLGVLELTLPPILNHAIGELMRAQTVELP